jgi:helicase required for RNAi-mediated heterochromatin assembly 1
VVRLLAVLEQNPLEVNLFFTRPKEIKINPSVLWIMVKEQTGFYKASCYTILAL